MHVRRFSLRFSSFGRVNVVTNSVFCWARMQNYLRPTFLPGIKVAVCLWRGIQREFVRDNPGRLCAATMDEIAKILIVRFHVRLTRPHELPLGEKLAQIESDLSAPGKLVFASRVFGGEDAHYSDSTRGTNTVHQRIHGHIWDFVTSRIMALVADALAAPIGAFAIGQIKDLLDRGALGIV